MNRFILVMYIFSKFYSRIITDLFDTSSKMVNES